MALFPTKKITALAPAVTPLTGFEEFECVQLGNSRKVISRNFVLPTDSLMTLSAMGGSLPGSRQLISSPTAAVVDGGPGGTVQIDVLLTGALPANPTGTVGLVAVNGVANTWMRSDAAPPLSQAITPSWTGTHEFLNNIKIGSMTFTGRQVGVTAARVQEEGNNNSTSALSLVRNNPSSGGGIITLGHSRGTDPGGIIIVADNDAIGQLDFAGADGVNLNPVGARIVAQVDGAPGAGSMPTRLVFATTPSGAATPTERLRIISNGAWGLAGATFGTAGDLFTTNGSGSAPTWTALNANAAVLAANFTWTGTHIFQGLNFELENVLPRLRLDETDAAANNRLWAISANSEQFVLSALNDAITLNSMFMVVDRTAQTIDSIALTSTALTWNGNPLLSTTTAFANPTGTVGLAAVNGAATTAMRSDAAPPLSQAIAPTWTALHTFTKTFAAAAPAILISSTDPAFELNETDAAADNRRWLVYASGEQLQFLPRNDADNAGNPWLTVDRTGTTVDSINLTATLIQDNGLTTLLVGTNASTTGIRSIQGNLNAAADNRYWGWRVNEAGDFRFGAYSDAAIASSVETTAVLVIERTGTTVDTVNFNSGTLQYGGLEVGFRGAPQNSQSANYTLVLSDAGKDILHPNGAGAGDTFTIPANGSTAFPIGTVISFTNMDANNLSIAITTDTLRVAGSTTTGTRTLAQYGVATIKKVESTVWIIYGVGLT